LEERNSEDGKKTKQNIGDRIVQGSVAEIGALTEQISIAGCTDASFLKDFFSFNDEISSKIE
jgi:hypothetical protein